MSMKIPFLRASIPDMGKWSSYLQKSFEAGQFSNFGVCYRDLQSRLAATYGRHDYAVALCPNATVAMSVALMAHGVRRKVIIPGFTFPATLHAVLGAMCDVVIADVDPDTWELSPDTLAAALKDHPDADAVVPVRVFGFQRDFTSLLEIADRHDAAVLVDAAAAIGKTHLLDAERIGSAYGHAEVFSFHVTKVFGIGEGSAVFLHESRLDAMERAMNFGFNADRSFGDGTNAKMDEVHCAIGLARLDDIDDQVRSRWAIATRYIEALGDRPNITIARDGVESTPWQTFPVKVRTEAVADRVVAHCDANGVMLRRYYAPSMSDGYRGAHAHRVRALSTPVADDLARTMLCLPIYPGLTENEQTYVLEVFQKALDQA